MEHKLNTTSNSTERSGYRAWGRTPSIADLRASLQEKEAAVQDLTKGQRQEAKLKKEVKILAQELQRTLGELDATKSTYNFVRQQLADLQASEGLHEEQQRDIAQLKDDIRILRSQLDEFNVTDDKSNLRSSRSRPAPRVESVIDETASAAHIRYSKMLASTYHSSEISSRIQRVGSPANQVIIDRKVEVGSS